MTVYLDCNATTPVDPRVADEVMRCMTSVFGNAGSRTHAYGSEAKQLVQQARDRIAKPVGAKREEVLFTSGATESNNLTIMGLAAHGETSGKKHIISTQIEHKAVLEPLEWLQGRGFEVTLVTPSPSGVIEASQVRESLRDDTLLVSVMHVNNETGLIQPVGAIAESLGDHPAYFHVDAAQSFGKLNEMLCHERIDLLSISGHKVHAPKGIGALVARRRRFRRPPMEPLFRGGGQERGLRPGTLPVPLIAGLGLASELANREAARRQETCRTFREDLMRELGPLEPVQTGDQAKGICSTMSLRIPGIDSEAAMLAWKGLVAVSNGSACTSSEYAPSHVLLAMGLSDREAQEVIRLSWCHETPTPDWAAMREGIAAIR